MSNGLAADEVSACPRCGGSLSGDFYGPCETCRSALRDAFRAAGGAVADVEYEPKMNVTPNAVALKDD